MGGCCSRCNIVVAREKDDLITSRKQVSSQKKQSHFMVPSVSQKKFDYRTINTGRSQGMCAFFIFCRLVDYNLWNMRSKSIEKMVPVFAEPDLLQTKQKTWVEIGDHVIL
jgi:hypothetical protein